MPTRPFEPPVTASHWNAIDQTICANASVSIARYTPDRRTQNQPNTIAATSAATGASTKRDGHRPAGLDRDRGRVRADAEVRGMAERRHAAGTEQELEARREQRGDQDVGREHHRVVVAQPAAARPASSSSDARRSAHRDAPARRTSSRCSGSGVVTGVRRAACRGVPAACTASTTAITTNSATSVSLGNAKRDADELDVAERDAQRLGQRDQQRGEERAGNRAQAADHGDDEGVGDRSARSMPRLAGSRGNCSAPASPARNAPSANTAVKSFASSMPSAAVSVRFSRRGADRARRSACA